MTSISGIERISQVARRLIHYESRFSILSPENRYDLGASIKSISEAIVQILDELNQGSVPHEGCRVFMVAVQGFGDKLSRSIETSEAERIEEWLVDSGDRDLLFTEFRSADRKFFLLEELNKASILLFALATGLSPQLFSEPEESN